MRRSWWIPVGWIAFTWTTALALGILITGIMHRHLNQRGMILLAANALLSLMIFQGIRYLRADAAAKSRKPIEK